MSEDDDKIDLELDTKTNEGSFVAMETINFWNVLKNEYYKSSLSLCGIG